jgi:site-specific DNA-adenine methylase
MSSNGNSQEKKFISKYAKSPEELVFYTDTDQRDYPIYLLPDLEIRYKRRPADVEKYAIFHVRSVELVDSYCARNIMYLSLCTSAVTEVPSLDEFIKKYNAELFKTIINTIEEKDRRVNVYAVIVKYEIYNGDYEELLGDAEAKALFLKIQPPYPLRADEKTKFAITYSFLKRLLAKLPQDIREKVEKLAYVSVDHVERKLGRFPVIKIKLPVPSSEFREFFEKAKKYIEELEKEVEEEPETPPIELPLPEIKPKELTVELETTATPAVVPSVEKPERSELVKVYLLSMRLPSKYLVQDVKVESSDKANMTREVRKWEGEKNRIASKLESIRTEAEKIARRIFCHIEEYGTWVAVTEEAVEEAKSISKFVTQKLQELMPQLSQVKNVNISRYYVKAVPVYLETEDARELLNAAIRKLSEDVNELAEKIKKAEEEKNKKVLRRLQQDYDYRRNLLEAFKKFLESLPK